MSATTPSDKQPIGSATMLEDGTIQLTLRAEGPGELLGDSFFSYQPDHPEYQEVLKHVGPLKPGQSVPVPPWD